ASDPLSDLELSDADHTTDGDNDSDVTRSDSEEREARRQYRKKYSVAAYRVYRRETDPEQPRACAFCRGTEEKDAEGGNCRACRFLLPRVVLSSPWVTCSVV